MESLSKFNTEIGQFLDSNASLLSEAPQDCINVKQLEAREQLISDLNNLIAGLQERAGCLAKVLETAQAAHEADIRAAEQTVRRLKHEREAPWTAVVRGGRSKPARIVSTALTPYTPPNVESRQSRIKFTDSIWLGAIRVKSFDDVKQDGSVYYIEEADHFAFRLNGTLFHGNIGTVYTEEKNPQKIKDCKFAGACMKQDTCDYYHDPREFPGSRDHRNFIAGSWLYAPPGSAYKNRQRSRRFGSREHLDVDIVGLQSDEITRFKDQTVHDVLCALILSEKYNQ